MKQLQKISLFETRDFSRNIDTSLAFIKQNYGAICKAICFFLPLLLVAAYLMPSSLELQSRAGTGNPLSSLEAYGTDGLFAYLAVALSSLLSLVYVISYMKEYSDSADGNVDQSAVWSRFSKAILPVFLCQIVYVICVSVGIILCIVPGVFIAVSCLFYAFVYINEGETIIGSIKRSYYLVKGNWWTVLGYVFLVVFIMAFVSGIFSIPLVFTNIATLFKLDFFVTDTYIFVSTLIAYIGDFFIAPLTTMSVGVLYYSLRNKHEGIDMETKIDDIGLNQEHDNANY